MTCNFSFPALLSVWPIHSCAFSFVYRCSLHNLTCNLCHDDISPSPPPPSPPFPPMYPYGWLIGFIGEAGVAEDEGCRIEGKGWVGLEGTLSRSTCKPCTRMVSR
jgi:hypothetical protein